MSTFKLEKCDHCQGSGHPDGILGGPQRGLCAYCGGCGYVPIRQLAASPPPASPADDVAGLQSRYLRLTRALIGADDPTIADELWCRLAEVTAERDAERAANADLGAAVRNATHLEVLAVDRARAAEASAAAMREALTRAGVIAFEMRARDKRNGILTDWWLTKLDALIAALL